MINIVNYNITLKGFMQTSFLKDILKQSLHNIHEGKKYIFKHKIINKKETQRNLIRFLFFCFRYQEGN